MKKILKIGCGCLGIIVIAIVMIFIAAAIDDSDPETERNAAETESSDTDFDMQLKWEKKGPQKFLPHPVRIPSALCQPCAAEGSPSDHPSHRLQNARRRYPAAPR